MKNKFSYFLETFKSCYCMADYPTVSYGDTPEGIIHITQKVNSNVFNFNNEIIVNDITWKEWRGQKIPFLFQSNDEEIITFKDNVAIINFDIVASGFYLLSGYQELNNTKRDALGRFLYKESIQYKLGITTIPVVNYYFDILKTAIEWVTKQKLLPGISGPHPFTLCLTHDIDNCENGWLEGSVWAIKKMKIFDPVKLLYLKFLKGKDVWFNFDSIIDIEKQYGATSSFFFLCRKGKYLGKPNADYDITDSKFAKVFDLIRNVGSEVGIHGSFGTHNNAQLLSKDIFVLGQKVKGGRFHFLEFEAEKTPGVLEKCGIEYDTSLGFAEHAGFRNSYCYPFKLYDFEKDRPSTVWEIPLILMDSTLYSRHYMGLNPEKSKAVIDNLLAEIKKFNGVFTILWHNTFFSDYKYNGWKAVYLYVLKTAKEQDALLTNAYQLLNNKDRQ